MIPPATLAAALRSAAPFPGGPTLDILCQALATAITGWLPTGVALVGVTAGVVGAGTVTGTLVFSGTPAAVLGAMGAFTGPTASPFSVMLSAGLNAGLAGLPYAGVSVGVGSGTDLSHVVSVNVPALATVLRSTHSAMCGPMGGSGAQVPGFYEALAAGVGVVVLTGGTLPPTGVVAPSGPLGPSSSVGTSTSVPV